VPETFYLRFRAGDPADRHDWVRKGLFTAGWRKVTMMEFGTCFPTREQALAFAQEFNLAPDVELVRISAEGVAHG
jgi:hypothetical protein